MKRGGFAIGVEYIKTETNIGTLMRSASNFGADMVFTVGRRYKTQSSDTKKTYRHIPVLHFETWEEYKKHAPLAWEPIGIEIFPNAKSLVDFNHPKSAVYLLGPEDGCLSSEAVRLCKRIIQIPTEGCLNVSVAGAIIMYDRLAKEQSK